MRTLVLIFLLCLVSVNVLCQDQLLITDLGVKPNIEQEQSVLINKIIKEHPGKTIYFPTGVYVINGINISNSIILTGGKNVVFRASHSATGPLISMQGGNVMLRGLIIDGSQERRTGIYIYTGADVIHIDSCLIKNMTGDSINGAYGIHIRRNKGEVKVENSLISDISGPGVGTQLDAYGPNRGIYINDVKDVVVSGCRIAGVMGYQDGAGIQYSLWEAMQLRPNVKIEDNIFESIYKRGVRVDADNAIIINNRFYNLKHDGKFSYAAISVYGNNTLVEGNYIEMNYSVYGIDVSSCRNNKVLGNDINIKQFPSGKGASVLLSNVDSVLIKGNVSAGKQAENMITEIGSNKNVIRD